MSLTVGDLAKNVAEKNGFDESVASALPNGIAK